MLHKTVTLIASGNASNCYGFAPIGTGVSQGMESRATYLRTTCRTPRITASAAHVR